ncbi:hypothetical protein SL1157_0376 [Ruegeria lacuscaerulensis ITI-1157]|nr:hypothetical protein SL1157_0376 [Ruegeria lacuscaerulensis ITI-1157]SHI33241.1 hypothetical protein SAMN05444404_0008 [Ruegeria lacuscaerulensis ITI-1157]
MPTKTIASTVRLSKQEARQIDARAAQNGFGTRSKYMIHAALNYGDPAENDVAAEIARISYALHQIHRAQNGRIHLLKKRDVADLQKLSRAALSAVIERAAR